MLLKYALIFYRNNEHIFFGQRKHVQSKNKMLCNCTFFQAETG